MPLARLLCLPLVFLLSLTAAAQNYDELKFYDNDYVDHVKSVRLHLNGVPHSYPLIELDGDGQLRLSFDDLNDEVRRYSYRFIHCDADWQPSGLSELEYLGRNTVGYIEEYDFSIRTLKEYIHYELVFPNRDMSVTASGNYLLVVYDEEDDPFPVITRRFMVQERIAGVTGRIMRPALVDQIHTHQEVDLAVNTKQLNVKNPMRELQAAVIQNGRWDNAITGIIPNLLQRDAVRFDYQGKVSFRGGNEYRNLDIRSVRAPRTEMVSVDIEEDQYRMMMEADRPRDNGTYIGYFDFNGDFINDRFNTVGINLGDLDEAALADFGRFNFNYTGDYVNMIFVLKTNAPLERDVYIIGGFNQHQLKREHRMVWNPAINAYVGQALLKQGFYNYHYVVEQNPGKGGNRADRFTYDRIEGSFDETENDYLALVYWRPVGGRYDRLVGTQRLNSNIN